jgi:hypothetical protein
MKKVIFSSIIISALGLLGCEKESTLIDKFTPIGDNNTNVKFLQMSPDVPQVNFFTNDTKATSVAPSATNVVFGMSFPSIYPNLIGYASVPAGSIKVDVKVPDSSSVLPGTLILSNTQTLAANKYYTYALVDSMKRISSVLVEDDPSVPDPTVSYFRLANFVVSSPVKIEFIKTSTGPGATSKVYSSVGYKSVSAFDTLTASGAIYKILLRNPTTDARLDSISAFTPIATKKYTIYCRGILQQPPLLPLPVTDPKRPIITSFTNF